MVEFGNTGRTFQRAYIGILDAYRNLKQQIHHPINGQRTDACDPVLNSSQVAICIVSASPTSAYLCVSLVQLGDVQFVSAKVHVADCQRRVADLHSVGMNAEDSAARKHHVGL